jgi:hypothetical protein
LVHLPDRHHRGHLPPANAQISFLTDDDRLKADFIASLPMQPHGCDVVYFVRLQETNLVCRDLDQALECYHIRCE